MDRAGHTSHAGSLVVFLALLEHRECLGGILISHHYQARGELSSFQYGCSGGFETSSSSGP